MSVYRNTFLSLDIEIRQEDKKNGQQINKNTMCSKLGLAEVTEEEINEEFISFVTWGSRHYNLDLNKVEI